MDIKDNNPVIEAKDKSKEQEKSNPQDKKRKVAKELSLKEKKRRNMLVFIPCISTLFLICIYWIFKPSGSQNLEDNVAGINIDIPLPKEDGMISDKKKAYEMELLTQKKDLRMQTLQDVENELGSMKADTITDAGLKTDLWAGNQKPTTIQQSASAFQDMNRELSSFYEPSQNEEMKAMQSKMDELSSRLQAAENGKSESEKNLEMMEKSYQMASRYLNPSAQKDSMEPAREVMQVTGVRAQPISGLDQNISDSAFISQYSKPRNLGFNTAIGTGYEISRNTLKACVYQDQTLENGQTVRLRLLEPLLAGKVIVPKNTLLSGVAQLQGERLDILISNIEFAGNIIPVGLAVYDTDGQKGINIPGSIEISATKEAAANIGAGMGNSFSFARSAGQQVTMDLTRGAMQAGSGYLSKKIRTVKVNLKAGYEVMLFSKQ